jgi:hypothetical protein
MPESDVAPSCVGSQWRRLFGCYGSDEDVRLLHPIGACHDRRLTLIAQSDKLFLNYTDFVSRFSQNARKASRQWNGRLPKPTPQSCR